MEGYDGMPITKIALQLSALVFVRPGELRRAEWEEVDLDNAIWRIPAAKMKGRLEHVIPLANQTVGLFELARSLTGGGKYVFPSVRSARFCLHSGISFEVEF